MDQCLLILGQEIAAVARVPNAKVCQSFSAGGVFRLGRAQKKLKAPWIGLLPVSFSCENLLYEGGAAQNTGMVVIRVFQIEYHFVWMTKDRYKVLTGEITK